jgi:hypothetical protein
MLIQGQVAPIASTQSIAPGTQAPIRTGNLGDLIVSELHGRYYESTYRRAVFSVCSTAAQATVAVGTTASYTGLYIQNPVGSTVNLVLLKANVGATAPASAAAAVVLETGYNASTNITYGGALVPTPNFTGTGASCTAVCGQGSATLPTAAVAKVFLATAGTLASASQPIVPAIVVDLEGAIILPPGAYAAFCTTAINTAAWWFGLTWEEVPI